MAPLFPVRWVSVPPAESWPAVALTCPMVVRASARQCSLTRQDDDKNWDYDDVVDDDVTDNAGETEVTAGATRTRPRSGCRTGR